MLLTIKKVLARIERNEKNPQQLSVTIIDISPPETGGNSKILVNSAFPVTKSLAEALQETLTLANQVVAVKETLTLTNQPEAFQKTLNAITLANQYVEITALAFKDLTISAADAKKIEELSGDVVGLMFNNTSVGNSQAGQFGMDELSDLLTLEENNIKILNIATQSFTGPDLLTLVKAVRNKNCKLSLLSVEGVHSVWKNLLQTVTSDYPRPIDLFVNGTGSVSGTGSSFFHQATDHHATSSSSSSSSTTNTTNSH
jgi:hypothetical protein